MKSDEISLLTERIRREAKSLGFFKIGIVPAKSLPSGDQLENWLRHGMQGDMIYMQRQAAKRKDPELVLHNVRSILVLALNYYARPGHSEDSGMGRVSRHAWGDDYHEIAAARLNRLRAFIESSTAGVQTIGYIDTGPVSEKVWGAQSAIGWMGKHSNLISREQGSWFFVAVILSTAELEYDRPENDYCGTCARCIPACPTGAIVAPYVVDARLCISYLTIEHKGAIPRSLRPLMGDHIFGCDDCQDVCPWNRFAAETPETGFHARQGNLMPDLDSLVSITRDEFNRRFKSSPVRRTGRNRFVRNAAIALGNSHAASSTAALAGALHDESPLVRAHAAWALGQIPCQEARLALESALPQEPDPEVREEILQALKDCPSRTAH